MYRGAGDLAACLASLRDLPPDTDIVIVDDASDDLELRRFLASPAIGTATVLRLARNGGFPAAANAGLAHSLRDGPCDVVLLNPDTLVPPGLIQRLAAAAYAAPDIGSVTPMSNDGTIVSCDVCCATDGAAPDTRLTQAEVDRLDGWFAAANAGERVDLPTGIGFCLFLRHDCLQQVGMLREDIFAQGYGEENDWCLRGRRIGWRHVAAADVFVAHTGGRSFGPTRALLMQRNQPILERMYPDHVAALADFMRENPLRGARRRVAARRWEAARRPGEAALLVTHDQGGGVERHVTQRAADLSARGVRPIVLRLAPDEAGSARCTLAGGETGADRFADLIFDLPRDLPELAALLRCDQPRWLELHHLAGLPPDIVALCRMLAIPYDVTVHDYALVCPRMTFFGADGRYCGEPAEAAACARCVDRDGSRLHEDIGVGELRARSRTLLGQARQVIVPCDDVARRLRRYVPGLAPIVAPWEPVPARTPDRDPDPWQHGRLQSGHQTFGT